MNQITPRELFEAAEKAKLKMPFLVLLSHKGSAPYVVACNDPGDLDNGNPASLADVECAVFDAMAERISTLAVAKIPANSPGVGNAEPMWCVSGVWFCMERRMPRTVTTFGPTRAAALLAACEVLAKEKA